MPGTRCTVAVCNNSLEKSKKANNPISYFNFPKDQDLRKMWIQKCHRDGQWNPNSCRICSIHFKESDFERDLQAELLNLPSRKKLKPTAIPSLFLTRKDMDNEIEEDNEREIRYNRRNNKLLVKSLLKSDAITLQPLSVTECLEATPHNSLEVTEYNILLKKYNALFEKHTAAEQELRSYENVIQELKTRITCLEIELEKVSTIATRQSLESVKLNEGISSFLSKSQKDLAVYKKKKVVWSSEDVAKAFTIRYLSRRCYVYLRDSLRYPLPGISSLQRWASKLNLRQGTLFDIIRIMKVASQTLNDFERTVILQFDEMKVQSLYEYDKAQDEVLGPHGYMQVVMARGLFSNWKQPVYIQFDQKMTSQILMGIISELHQINYDVVACVSDCGGGNVGLWKQLSISIENPYFSHPILNHPIYFFPDAPHLLKLIRNWLLDTGFVLKDGKKVSKIPLQELISSCDTEINAMHKLTRKHIECEKTQRQNVSLAAQLLSHSCATALKHYTPGADKQLALSTGDFIEKINCWFNIMNSYAPNNNLEMKKPYGSALQYQDKILDEVYELIKSMRCLNKNKIQIFQQGILMSITSLKALFRDMARKYSVKYLLTHRLNQDSLENFFSQIRTRGGLHDHPSPLNAIYRIRMIILGKNPGLVQRNLNVQNIDDCEYIVSKVLNEAHIPVLQDNHQNKLLEESTDTSTLSESSLSCPSKSNKTVIACTTEQDGLIYLAGWIAKKFKGKYENLGDYTYKSRSEYDPSLPSWLQHLSFGGLTEPSPEWLEKVMMMEKIFLAYHKKSTIRKGKLVTKRLISCILKKCGNIIPNDLISSYVLQRTFIRIKFENNKLKYKVPTKRKASEDIQRKVSAKYKKIVN